MKCVAILMVAINCDHSEDDLNNEMFEEDNNKEDKSVHHII